MRCSTCGVALPVFGLLSAVAVFAAQTTRTTGSDLTPAGGMVVAQTESFIPAIESAKAEAPAAVNMNDWQETAIRRGSIRRL